jgi:hypothetical protein
MRGTRIAALAYIVAAGPRRDNAARNTIMLLAAAQSRVTGRAGFTTKRLSAARAGPTITQQRIAMAQSSITRAYDNQPVRCSPAAQCGSFYFDEARCAAPADRRSVLGGENQVDDASGFGDPFAGRVRRPWRLYCRSRAVAELERWLISEADADRRGGGVSHRWRRGVRSAAPNVRRSGCQEQTEQHHQREKPHDGHDGSGWARGNWARHGARREGRSCVLAFGEPPRRMTRRAAAAALAAEMRSPAPAGTFPWRSSQGSDLHGRDPSHRPTYRGESRSRLGQFAAGSQHDLPLRRREC